MTREENLDKLPFMERWLVAPKILNLILNVSSYSSQVFFIFYCTNTLKIGSDDYGLFVNLSSALACFIGVNLWTYVADRFRAHRTVLILVSLLYAIFFSLTFFKPYDMNNRFQKIAYVSIFYGLQNACCSAMYPLLDNQVMMMLTKHPLFSKEIYGRQRLWGTVGHALSSIAVGAFVSEKSNYFGMFVCNIISTATFIVAVLIFAPKDGSLVAADTSSAQNDSPSSEISKSQLKKALPTDESIQVPIAEESIPANISSSSCSISSAVTSISFSKKAPTLPNPSIAKSTKPKAIPKYLSLLKDPNFSFFLFVIFVTGVAKHVLSIFSGLFVSQRFNLSEDKVGLTQACHVIPEILLFYFGKQINHAIGLHWMLIVAQLATIIRVLAFAWVPSSLAWSAFIIESFKGVSTSFLIMSGVRLSHELAPPGLEATAQGAFVAVFQGLATAVSGIANYVVSAQTHLRHHNNVDRTMVLFKYTGYISLLAVMLLAMKWAYVDRIICLSRSRASSHS